MKKFSFSLIAMLLMFGAAMAQQSAKQEVLYKDIPQDVPQAVLDAIESDTEGVKFQNELPVAITKKAKRLEPQKALSGKSYSVLTKTHSLNGKTHTSKTCVYDAEGSMLSSKEVLVNKALPVVALRAIGKAYDGWLLVRTRAVIESHGDQRTAVYTAVLKNGKDKERVMLNGAGEFINNKKERTVVAQHQDSASK